VKLLKKVVITYLKLSVITYACSSRIMIGNFAGITNQLTVKDK